MDKHCTIPLLRIFKIMEFIDKVVQWLPGDQEEGE
jgi:hypothetical protein